MASYNVRIKASAGKEIESVGQKKDRLRLVAAIRMLAHDPRGRQSSKLAGYDDRYRLRVGAYRVIYSISDAELAVVVFRVAHRKEAYR